MDATVSTLSEVKAKGRIPRVPRKANTGVSVCLSADSAAEKAPGGGAVQRAFQGAELNNRQPRALYPTTLPFTREEEMKTFQEQQKLRQLTTM